MSRLYGLAIKQSHSSVDMVAATDITSQNRLYDCTWSHTLMYTLDVTWENP